MLFLTLKVLVLPCCKERCATLEPHTRDHYQKNQVCILLRCRRLNLSEIEKHQNNPIRQRRYVRPEDVLLVVYKDFLVITKDETTLQKNNNHSFY